MHYLDENLRAYFTDARLEGLATELDRSIARLDASGLDYAPRRAVAMNALTHARSLLSGRASDPAAARAQLAEIIFSRAERTRFVVGEPE